ncbi:MAG: putative two-component sensor histidine kinase [Anaerolineaceae bacterium]|nr:MAG: putative two-component sensor histidine kinase [Anaerolineaceae bacterium]
MPKNDLVLLAFDDSQVLPLFERALAAASYSVAIAQDRKALDQALQESTPALLIIAEKLGGGDGLAISAELLERFPTLPILLFLHADSPQTVKKALHIGMSDVLAPPLKIGSIEQAVANSIRRANRIGDWTRREVRRTTASLQQRLDDMQKLDIVINHIEDGVIILDEKTHILLINPAARREFGLWKEDELGGKPALELIPHPDLRTLLTTGANNSLPHSEITFDDGRVLSAQYTPIPGIGAAITLQDITHLKQIDRLKTEFVHTVSHDLRSPLTAILGYVELLGRIGPLTDQQKEFVHRVTASVQNITALVNDLLELGRIEAGFDSQKETIPLEGIISYTIENMRPQISERKQQLRLELPEQIPSLRGNPIRLRQMLDNLIGNAIKYTPEGGNLSVEVEVQDGQVILRVADSGVGIPPADQPHIFDKFYRASNVPKGVGGSGLGLAIVKSIVDNHHGRIWVESVIGEGTTFIVVLPTYRPEDTRPTK